MTHDALRNLGFLVELLPQAASLPAALLQRYPNLPADYVAFISRLRCCHMRSDTTWLLTPADYQTHAEAAFAWNEFEQLSLEAACKPEETQAILAFWQRHCPIMLCVAPHYAYFAIDLHPHHHGNIVFACEPEFETTTVIAADFAAFINAGLAGTWPPEISVFLPASLVDNNDKYI